MVQEKCKRCSETEILTIKHLCKKFKNKVILRDISLDISSNVIHAIIGPNGAGKTTLIRAILGLYKMQEGSINYYIDKKEIACLLENDYLFENKTGIENIKAFCNYFNVNENIINKRILHYSSILNLDNHLEYKVKIYSKGMKRKLSILITLLRDSKLIIFDEPTSGIDPQSRMEIRKLFKLLKKENKTIILTSHDLEEVKKVSDIITIINNE